MDMEGRAGAQTSWPSSAPWLRDRRGGGGGSGPEHERRLDRQQASEPEPDRQLCCSACRAPVTSILQRATRAGRHEHLCRNPDGVLFRVGCYGEAPGCAMIGRATAHWTWFPGYRWRVALCGRCGAHLGWHYQDGSGEGFFGLIVDRLRHCDGPAGS